jgi:nickel-dependent lactate racemase
VVYAGFVIISLSYGERPIEATAPDTATVLVPQRTPPLADPAAAVHAAIASPIGARPLAEIARGHRRAAIVVSDVTRPVPNAVLLPPLLETIEAAGVARGDITIVIGTGLHRPSRAEERERILGAEIAARYRTIDHDARDRSTQSLLVTTARGVDVWVNRAYMDAGLRVLTGFVEPHLFAGYSGGGKAMLPGICGADAIMANHDARMIGHPKATWCTTEGNPIFEEVRAVALKSEPSFILNVTLDERKRVTGVFAGEMVAAHDAAMAQAARQHIRPIPRLFDVVVATNMGYPADLSLYQAVKGMSVAAAAAATGGAILLVAECREGLGGPEYVELMRSEASPAALLGRFGRDGHATVHDQWQVQVQAMVQARCDVWLHSSLDRAAVESAHLRFAPDVDGTLASILARRRRELGREPSVCVLPFGQLTVPRLAGSR